jgi:hypothetical protein
MKPPDDDYREKNRRERIWFVKKSAEWVNKVPNEIWSHRQSEFINSLFLNRKNFPLTKEQYLCMIEKARSVSNRQTGSPPMPKNILLSTRNQN